MLKRLDHLLKHRSSVQCIYDIPSSYSVVPECSIAPVVVMSAPRRADGNLRFLSLSWSLQYRVKPVLMSTRPSRLRKAPARTPQTISEQKKAQAAAQTVLSAPSTPAAPRKAVSPADNSSSVVYLGSGVDEEDLQVRMHIYIYIFLFPALIRADRRAHSRQPPVTATLSSMSPVHLLHSTMKTKMTTTSYVMTKKRYFRQCGPSERRELIIMIQSSSPPRPVVPSKRGRHAQKIRDSSDSPAPKRTTKRSRASTKTRPHESSPEVETEKPVGKQASSAMCHD